MEAKRNFHLNLNGTFSIFDEQGHDVTPAGNKECALIALLATNHLYRRSRSWIKSILWSESSPEYASSNLRQTLWRVRRHFGGSDIFIQSSSSNIWLNNKNIQVLPNSNECSVFLEGIDVIDEAFEDWLLDMRHQRYGIYSLNPVTTISAKHLAKFKLLHIVVSGTKSQDQAETIFDYLSCRLNQWGIAARLMNNGIFESPRLKSQILKNHIVLQLKFTHENYLIAKLQTPNEDNAWSFLWPLSVNHKAPLSSYFNAIDNMVLGLLPAMETRLSSPVTQALNMFFSRNPQNQENAKNIFLDASADSAVAKAWYAYSLVVGNAEKIKKGTFFESEIVIENLRKSLESESYNPVVNAITGHIYSLVFRDFEKADNHLSLARNIDPNNKLVYTFSATNANYSERPEKALYFANSASHQAGLPALDFLISTSRLSSMALLGKFNEAISIGESVLLEQPHFLGARRYLTSCYHGAGLTKKRELMISSTRKLDPEFTPTGIRQPFYPLPSKKSVELLSEAMTA